MASLKALTGMGQASDHVALPAERLYRYSTSSFAERATRADTLGFPAGFGLGWPPETY